MPSIADTVTEMIQWVFPEHAGAPGQIHGGRMMQWITQAGTMAASRVARGTVVLGAMDDIDFLHPVKVGQIAILRAQVEYVGTSSLEVGVRVWGEDVATGARTVTLNSHLVFVSVDDETRPRYRKRGMHAFDPMGSPMNGYWQVPPDVIEDADELATWVREALEVAGRARTRPRRSPKKAPAKKSRPAKKGPA